MPSFVYYLIRSVASSIIVDKQRHHYFSLSSLRRSSITVIICLLHISTINSQCYFTPGITIDGADYRQYVDELQTQRDCAKVCLDDCACMAFVWYSNNNTCLLKSQSINNHMKYASNDVVFGICIVPDSDRDRLWDHVISGYVLAIHEQIDREDCSQLCENVTNATLYSWTPLKTNDDIGACTCLERMTGLMVHFGASSGFL